MTTAYAHYVCFDCRKAWAPAVIRNRRERRLGECDRPPEGRPCPDCGKSLIGLGLTFKPPKQSDRRAWRELEAAARAGERFLKP
jgi:hypothetical protein